MNLIVNYKKAAGISLAILVFAIVNGFILFPSILKFMLKHVSKFGMFLQDFDEIPFEYSQHAESSSRPWLSDSSALRTNSFSTDI